MRTILFVFMTLALTVYGQIVIKSRILQLADGTASKNDFAYLLVVFTDIWVLSGLAAAVLAGFCWALALRDAALSFIYPFMALSFIVVPLLAACLFGEKIGPMQAVGMLLIVGGVSLATFAR